MHTRFCKKSYIVVYHNDTNQISHLNSTTKLSGNSMCSKTFLDGESISKFSPVTPNLQLMDLIGVFEKSVFNNLGGGWKRWAWNRLGA